MNLPETRHSLLVRLQERRDEQAWEEFLRQYEPFLLNLFRRRGLQEADARDVTQQVLISVATKVGDWQTDGKAASFRRWLSTIARHAAIRHLTRHGRQPITGLEQDIGENPATLEAVAWHEYQREVLAWTIEQIRSEFREASWLAFWETAVNHRPVPEVASELQISAGAIYMARSRIMARLRQKAKEFDPE